MESDCDVIDAFSHFGEEGFDVDTMAKVLEGFVCTTYSRNTKFFTLQELRWELFQSKNMEAEKLPPTLAAFKPHIQRANFVCIIGKGYSHPNYTYFQYLRMGGRKQSMVQFFQRSVWNYLHHKQLLSL